MIPNDVPLTAFRSFEHGMVELKASAPSWAQVFGKGEIPHQRKVEIRLSERAELRRQAGNVASSNDCGLSELGGFGLHQDRFSSTVTILVTWPTLSRMSTRAVLIDRQFELGGKLGKTGHLGRQAVLTRQYGKEGIVATAVCLGG